MPEEQKRQVRSVKIKKMDKDGKEFVPEITLYDPEKKCNENFDNCQNLCHKDFYSAILRLGDHLMILSDADEPENFEQSDVSEKFEARGYSLSGAEDETRITLKGHRKTTFAGAITFNATILYNQNMDNEGAYDFIDDLKAKIRVIEIEALKYCFEGRKYENGQLSMDLKDDGNKVTTLKIANPVGGTPGSIEDVVKDLVKETNAKTGDAAVPPVAKTPKEPKAPKAPKEVNPKKKPQTAENPAGE